MYQTRQSQDQTARSVQCNPDLQGLQKVTETSLIQAKRLKGFPMRKNWNSEIEKKKKPLTLSSLLTTQGAIVDNVDQDQTAQSVLSDI